jgi:sugar lactone lactonase YvrE
LKPHLLPAVALFLCVTLSLSSNAQNPPRAFELKASSPEFWKLVPKQAKLEVVAKGFGFTEGPVWDPAGFLYVSAEEQNKIFKVSLDGKKTELVALGDPDGSTYDRQHRPGGIWIWDSQGHHLGTIVMPEQPANLAWGGSQLTTLYITATTAVYKLEMSAPGFVPYLDKAKTTF